MALLRYKADIRTLLTVSFYFVAAIIPWFLWNELNIWQIVLFVILNCYLSFTCAVIVHNSIHVPIFMKKDGIRFFRLF